MALDIYNLLPLAFSSMYLFWAGLISPIYDYYSTTQIILGIYLINDLSPANSLQLGELLTTINALVIDSRLTCIRPMTSPRSMISPRPIVRHSANC